MAKKSAIGAGKFKYKKSTPKGYLNLLDFFRNNMVELRFTRKNMPKIRKPGKRFSHRRMVCTSNWNFISKPSTATMLGWEKPQGPEKGFKWYLERDLLITWDLLNMDWRIIHLKDVEIIAAIPLVTFEDKEVFKLFYKSQLKKLGPKADPRGNKRNRIADK